MDGKVGFFGLGLMGKPMARNLMEAGYNLVVHDIPPDDTAKIKAAIKRHRRTSLFLSLIHI